MVNVVNECSCFFWMELGLLIVVDMLVMDFYCDVLIVGLGIMGLFCVYEFLWFGCDVIVIDWGVIGLGMIVWIMVYFVFVFDDYYCEFICIYGKD